HRTGLSLYASWNEQSHEDQPLLDQALSSLTAGVERQFSQAASLFLDTGFSNADFQDTGRDYTEVQTGLTFSWRLSRSLFFNLAYDYIDRNSDLTLGDYTENRYWLSVGYGRGEPRSTAMRPAFGVDAADPGT
ncbi:MAG TPA: outer membrane beta-barrel protein, partial [Steroidobacter sp.]|nr:outer membrane beta-barrel protein [Steroidobacter sp.]